MVIRAAFRKFQIRRSKLTQEEQTQQLLDERDLSALSEHALHELKIVTTQPIDSTRSTTGRRDLQWERYLEAYLLTHYPID